MIGIALFARLQAFLATDAGLIESCKRDKIFDYVSSTGVVGVLLKSVLSIAHVGDSRMAVGRREGDSFRGLNMTVDHKPDKPAELRRIEAVSRPVALLCTLWSANSLARHSHREWQGSTLWRIHLESFAVT